MIQSTRTRTQNKPVRLCTVLVLVLVPVLVLYKRSLFILGFQGPQRVRFIRGSLLHFLQYGTVRSDGQTRCIVYCTVRVQYKV